MGERSKSRECWLQRNEQPARNGLLRSSPRGGRRGTSGAHSFCLRERRNCPEVSSRNPWNELLEMTSSGNTFKKFDITDLFTRSHFPTAASGQQTLCSSCQDAGIGWIDLWHSGPPPAYYKWSPSHPAPSTLFNQKQADLLDSFHLLWLEETISTISYCFAFYSLLLAKWSKKKRNPKHLTATTLNVDIFLIFLSSSFQI